VVLRQLSDQIPVGSVQGIGMSGHIGTHVLADSRVTPLGPAYTWQDARMEAVHDEVRQRMSDVEAASAMLARLPPTGAWPLNRLLWLRRHAPATLEHASFLLQPKDFVAFKLTGTVVSDPSSWRGAARPDGSRSDVLDRFGLPWILPAMRSPTEVIGEVTPEAGAQCGMPVATPVVNGWNDLNSSIVGAGLSRAGQGFDVTGTSEHLGGIAVESSSSPALVSYPFVLGAAPVGHLVYGVTSNCGNVITWLQAMLDLPADPAAFGPRLDRALGATRPGADGLQMVTYLAGERSPVWDPRATGRLAGITLRHHSAHLVRAALEGMAYNLRRIRELRPQAELTSYRVVGGPAQLASWNQLKADVLGVRLELTEVPQAAPLGAAILAAVGLGIHSSVEVAASAMVRVTDVVEPDDSARDVYDEPYGAYLRLCENDTTGFGRGIAP
jgi:sugar (pentulose or hexulose) kinase